MTLHLIKLCVGAASIEDLADWQKARAAERKKAGQSSRIFHTTFQTPKRDAELLDGGSLYWVIKGTVQVRQKLLGFEQGKKSDGSPACLIVLDAALVPVRPVPAPRLPGLALSRRRRRSARPRPRRQAARRAAAQDAPRARRARPDLAYGSLKLSAQPYPLSQHCASSAGSFQTRLLIRSQPPFSKLICNARTSASDRTLLSPSAKTMAI